MQNIIGKFIGTKKIALSNVADRKTYLGKEVLVIFYEDGTSEEIPAELVEKIATDVATDDTTLREHYVNPVIEKLLAVLLDAEVKIIDIEYILGKTSSSLQISLDKATEKLWKKDLFARTLADINKVLTIQDDTNKPTSKERGGKKAKPSTKSK